VLREDATFYLVLNPDELSINETERAIAQLTEYDLGVAGLVVNKVTPEPEDHEEGRGARYLRARCATERERIETVRESFDEPIVAEIESRVEEVKGELLASVADELQVDVRVRSPEGPA
jgi:arsenite-transporting ATPase